MKKRIISIILILLLCLTCLPVSVFAEDETEHAAEGLTSRFTDVNETDWYYDSVCYVAARGIMTGMRADYFGAAEKLSRGQFATIIYRLSREEGAYKAVFPDVKESDWYGIPVSWAAENGVITGYQNGKFGPADDITREQLATMLYRYAKYIGYDTSEKADFSKYPDSSDVSSWAIEAMQWAVGTGIIKGQGGGKYLDPQGKASRAECATMVMRFMQKYVEKQPQPEENVPMTYEEFKSLSNEQQIEVFSGMTGPEIYDLVAGSDESWPVTNYDLITPNNAKETIVLVANKDGDLHFNLAWPCYGGFVPASIASIGELTGKLDVSRDGGDGGHSMSYGRNEDGSYPNDSQRSVPKTSATVRTGILDADQYNKVAGIVANGESEEDRLSALTGLGYDSETAKRFISDQAAWLNRDEVSGPNNIDDGAKAAGHTVDSRYGYFGITAPWIVDDLNLVGGGGQLETIFSWGTLCDSGLISDTGTAEIH